MFTNEIYTTWGNKYGPFTSTKTTLKPILQ